MDEVLIAQKFKPNQQDHVMWLQTLFQLTTLMQNSQNSNIQKHMKKMDLDAILRKNPMGHVFQGKVAALEFPMIHMAIGLKYSEAVLNGTAWIPPQD